MKKLAKNLRLNDSTALAPMNYKGHQEEIYTGRLLNCTSLLKPTNWENLKDMESALSTRKYQFYSHFIITY